MSDDEIPNFGNDLDLNEEVDISEEFESFFDNSKRDDSDEGLDIELDPDIDEIKEFPEYNSNKAFQAAVNAVDTDHWTRSVLDEYLDNPNPSREKDRYRAFEIGREVSQSNSYRGDAGNLKIAQLGDIIKETEASYRPSEDAVPESEHVHGAIMHAVGVLAKYGGKEDGGSIDVNNLSEDQAQEVVQAYTVIDSALQSDTRDEIRGIAESVEEVKDEYGIDDVGREYLEDL